MVYHEVRERKSIKYNYLVHNERIGGKWKKFSKYIGKGDISKTKIQTEIEKFKKELLEEAHYLFLTPQEVKEIEDLRSRFNEYLLKAGKNGIESFKEWFFTELTYNSNAIEGNTLSLRETSSIINENITPEGATLRELNEAKNHKEALEFLEMYRGELNESLILKLHSFILKNIDNKNAGKYRKIQVFIRGSPFVPTSPVKVPMLIKDLVKWYKDNKKKYHPLELAILVSMKFVTIHPFIDGNGRVSRLIMNFLLKKKNYPEINLYVRLRNPYLAAVEKANKENYSEIVDFALYTLKKNYEFLYESKTK